jgi:transcription initiation factor IIE alpha subunit
MGRQLYHGQQELVMSNALDIIEAETIARLAEITRWDENNDHKQLASRYWRQIFDVSAPRRRNKLAGLSKLMRYCTCDAEYNPDDEMYQCERPECRLWNHARCVADSNGTCLGCGSQLVE